MNARYYVPEVGRFASPDSIVPDPGNRAGDRALQGGFAVPCGVSASLGYTIMVYDQGSPSPWFIQNWFD